MIDKRDKRKKIYRYITNPVSRNAYNLLWKRFFRNRDILGKLQFQRELFYSYIIFENQEMVKLERA